MGKALRDSNGKFLPGNKLAQGNTFPYQPRTSSGHFKSVVSDILAGISNDEVLSAMNRIAETDPATFMYIWSNLKKIESDASMRELKAEIEMIKLQPKDTSSNDVIFISYEEEDEDDKEVE